MQIGACGLSLTIRRSADGAYQPGARPDHTTLRSLSRMVTTSWPWRAQMGGECRQQLAHFGRARAIVDEQAPVGAVDRARPHRCPQACRQQGAQQFEPLLRFACEHRQSRKCRRIGGGMQDVDGVVAAVHGDGSNLACNAAGSRRTTRKPTKTATRADLPGATVKCPAAQKCGAAPTARFADRAGRAFLSTLPVSSTPRFSALQRSHRLLVCAV